MGTKYTTVSISGYNATPPVDDGTVSEANKVKWSTIKTKLPDPLKTAIESIDSALTTHFNVGPTALTTSTTLDSTHFNKIIQVSGAAVTLTLTDAATLTGGWYCWICNTDSSNTVTLGRATGADTINGTAANTSIYPGQTMMVFVIAAANGFLTVSDVSARANNTFSGNNTHSGIETFNKEILLGASTEVTTGNSLQNVGGSGTYHIAASQSFNFKTQGTSTGDRFKIYNTGGVTGCNGSGVEATGGAKGDGTCNFTEVWEQGNHVYSANNPGPTARAWGTYTNASALTKGFNVSTVGAPGGNNAITITFTSALPDANYAVGGSILSAGVGILVVDSRSTTTVVLRFVDGAGNPVNPTPMCFWIFD